jgi:hypothetical protein
MVQRASAALRGIQIRTVAPAACFRAGGQEAHDPDLRASTAEDLKLPFLAVAQVSCLIDRENEIEYTFSLGCRLRPITPPARE